MAKKNLTHLKKISLGYPNEFDPTSVLKGSKDKDFQLINQELAFAENLDRLPFLQGFQLLTYPTPETGIGDLGRLTSSAGTDVDYGCGPLMFGGWLGNGSAATLNEDYEYIGRIQTIYDNDAWEDEANGTGGSAGCAIAPSVIRNFSGELLLKPKIHLKGSLELGTTYNGVNFDLENCLQLFCILEIDWRKATKSEIREYMTEFLFAEAD